MKKIHLLAMLLFTACVVPVSQAQESLFLKDPSTKNKLLQLDLDVGTCFDLAYRGKGNMYTAMSDRKSVFPAINLRLQHFFSRKWGWYTNIRLGIPVKYRRDCYTELVHAVEENYYVNNLIPGTQKPDVNPCLDFGVAYRFENSHWAFYPRLGIGVNSISYQRVCAELKKKGGNELYKIEYRGDDESNYGSESIDAFILSAGVTANYKLSRNCFLLLNVNYIQPLGRFTYRKYVTDLYTGEKVERGVYKSSTFARDLNVSVGFGFPFYLGRKTNRKSSHRERTRQLMEQKRKTYGLFPGNK